MSNVWPIAAPKLVVAANVAIWLVALIFLGLLLSPFLMRRPRAHPRTRTIGCFLYSIGLWVFVRFLIGGLGAVLGIAVYLWEKGKDIEAIKHSTEELQKKFSVTWLLIFVGAIGLLALLGDKLRKISEKHHDIARWGFQKLFRSRVPSTFPDLANTAGSVLAYRAVWEPTFNVPGAKNIDGWKRRDLSERLRLIYFFPLVTAIQPSTDHAGATVTITGTGFIEARAVHFGSVSAATMTVNSDTQITATIPPGKGAVAVMVTTRAGVISTSSAAATFTYLP